MYESSLMDRSQPFRYCVATHKLPEIILVIMGQKNSKLRVTETDRAVLQLKRSKDEIHKFTRRTDSLISQERGTLKQLIRENPSAYKKDVKVRFLLKRIHYQETLLQQASDQLINLENMASTLEFKLIEKQFINGLKNGNDILTKLNREFEKENVSELMDNVQDQIAYQEEIDGILSQSIAGVNDYEDEIDKELDQMEAEVLAKELPSTDHVAPIQVPQTKPEQVSKPEGEPEPEREREREPVALLS